MAGIGENVATHVAESLADKAMQELKYLCCYKSYVDDFEEQKKHLKARRETIQKDIKEAQDRNENQIESEVELWLRDADALINEDTKGKKKWFGLVPNCFWQYNRGKDLEDNKQRIQKLVEQSNFPRVARSTGLPGIEFYSIENFIQLKDRKLQFGKLTEALKNDKKFVIGLYGLGGTGKTTMAIEVGKEVAVSKVFDKVIFSVVSRDPNLKNIRDNIAKHLNLPLKEKMNEYEQARELWKRIAEGGEKVLIILDDVWKKLSLKDIGIPLGCHGKSCCSVLLTTRDRGVCNDMGCHEPIELEVLSEKDAVDLFLSYAAKSTDSSSNGFKDVALGIVKECGRLPVAIVAVASALKSKPLNEWNDGLKRLQNPKSIHDVQEDLKEAYNSLRLSYDYLENKAKQLFLLCSLFPDDYEIPLELLTRIAIGMGLCGGVDKYFAARSYFTPIKNMLMDSCLLLKVDNEAVKMHDLVREVALWIGNKLVQVVKDSSTMLMENIQYSSWNINDFPSHFDGRKLEVLLLWISNAVKVPDGIFEGMENVKILALMNRSYYRISSASLFQSHSSLTNVRSLAIEGFELGDISILANLKSLESLELRECSMIELPKEIGELEKLRLLEMVQCHIERNNPFKVIGSCLHLEELYLVSNWMDKACELERHQITTFPKLERYQIKEAWGGNYFKVDFSISRYFDSNNLRVKFSVEIFKSLLARAEVLKLDGDYFNRGWTNVVPDILPVKNHLTRLYLRSINGIKCLILTESLQSDVAIFSKLVELELYNMDVRELCCGSYPVNFLKQLEKLHLYECKNLEGSLFDGKLELCNLKSIYLYGCSMACLFHPFTAQSLKQLQMLEIGDCSGLKYIVEPMEDHDPNQKSHDSMFSKLKYLEVRSCPELEFILPICFCKDLPLLESMEIAGCEKLKYIFGQYPNERDLHHMGKEVILQSLEELRISSVPNFINLYAECYLSCPCYDKVQKSSPSTNVEDCTSSLSRGLLCCFWPKSNASTIYHPSTSTNHNKGMKVNYVVNRAHGLFTPPLYPYTLLRRLEIFKLVGLKSLFTLSIASSLKLLEILKVEACNALEHIVTDKEDDHDHNSIFPNLREVEVFSCSDLEYLFSISSGKLPRLLYVSIRDTPQLGEVFRWKHGQGQKLVMEDVFPKLCVIRLENLPTLHTICQGIDFHTVKFRRVLECPAISLTSANDSREERNEFLQSSVHEDEDASYLRKISLEWATAGIRVRVHAEAIRAAYLMQKNRISPNLLESTKTSANEIVEEKLSTTPSSNLDMSEEASKEADEKDSTIQKQESSSPNLMEQCKSGEGLMVEEKGSQEYIGNDSTMSQQNNASPNFEKSNKEVSKEIAKNDSSTYKQNNSLSNLTESINASTNEIVEEKLCTTLSSNSNVNSETSKNEIVDEKLSTSNAAATSSSKSNRELCGKESMDGQQALGESRSSNQTPQRVEEPSDIECFSKDTSKERTLTIPPSITKTTSPPISLICSPKKPENATSAAHVEIESGSSAIIDQYAQGQIMVNQSETSIEDDLTKLFRIMKDGSDMEVGLSYVSNIAAFKDDKVAKAFSDIESSLKMDLHQIAISEEHTHCLKNALNFLATHFSEEEPSSHDLVRRKIESLHQEIQRIISYFKQSCDTLDTFTKLKEKEKWIDEQHSQRLEAATTLVSEIRNAEDHMNELKEQICRLQDELKSKEKEFEEYEIKLSSLQKQKKECVWETIEFMEEYEAVKKDKSYVGDGQTKARQEIKRLENQWPSCVADLRKTSFMLGILLKHKP